MKRIPMLKSTLGLLVIAGACMPISSLAANDNMEPTWSLSNGAVYDNLRNLQSYKPEPSQAGAQGPIRTESMGPMWSFSDGAVYDNLRNIQSFKSESGQSGAQGPIRTESMGSQWVYSDSATYDNLRTQSEH